MSLLSDEEFECGIERIQQEVVAAEARGEELRVRADLRLYATFGTRPEAAPMS